MHLCAMYCGYAVCHKGDLGGIISDNSSVFLVVFMFISANLSFKKHFFDLAQSLKTSSKETLIFTLF